MIGDKSCHIVSLENEQILLFTAKSGLTVNAFDDFWIIRPNKGKGWRISVDWVHSSDMADDDRELIMGVLMHYARTMAASTASGIVCNIKPFVMNGIPSLVQIKAIWSGLKTNNKKGLNQFFRTLSRQGNKRFDEYHGFTSTHLDKNKTNILDPSSGALSEIEFDSLATQLNQNLQKFDWACDREFIFFQSHVLFSRLRSRVTSKLLLSIVRRPIQIALLKWSDVIPSGASFHDVGIHAADEIGTLGGQTLQLRVFIAKTKGAAFSRDFPERYPLHLSEDLSKVLIEYKNVILKGLTLLMQSVGIKMDQSELLSLMGNMPMFPDVSLFNLRLDSIDLFKSMFTPKSTAYHVSEASITQALRWIRLTSDRTTDCVATSNRIRHTVLTRGAQDGLSAIHLAKITGVTVPAARHYIDLNYQSRREIDSKYIGNEFLRKAFSCALTEVSGGDSTIVDRKFNPVGAPYNMLSCVTCSTAMGRPLGCYGCPNFRPILEADHRSVLGGAEEKLAVNRNSLINPLYGRSIEKLEKQILWVKLTITVCDEVLAGRHVIDA
ncbi:hypothetical protein [Pseudomonas sp. BGI-2]|uniref:hypothetical protein n=1 Tax=Pseudomonas sp. BGI-2 TaxID=2528211 RepID=UPI001034B8F2|nr:hypothetical protein [Pseudomonas sp. BGI-2]TBN47114.1 hypothetical protein EYC95_10520 [Pseudomonas sp. BGI-2]